MGQEMVPRTKVLTHGPLGAGNCCWLPKLGLRPPDASLERPGTPAVDDWGGVGGGKVIPRPTRAVSPLGLPLTPSASSGGPGTQVLSTRAQADAPSQPSVVTSANGLSQRSHWRPRTPGLQEHWPVSAWQVRLCEPAGKHSQGRQASCSGGR